MQVIFNPEVQFFTVDPDELSELDKDRIYEEYNIDVDTADSFEVEVVIANYIEDLRRSA